MKRLSVCFADSGVDPSEVLQWIIIPSHVSIIRQLFSRLYERSGTVPIACSSSKTDFNNAISPLRRKVRTPYISLLLIALFVIDVFLMTTVALAQVKGISGQVINSANKERLPFATVIVKGTRIGTQSNVEGFFFLPTVPDSEFVLLVSYVGYVPRETLISPGSPRVDLVIRLQETTVGVEGVTVFAKQSDYIKAEDIPSLATMSPGQVAALPSVGQVDIFRTIQLLPGISATKDGSSGLYVRGGTPDQNLVLFDDMNVYHVDHFFGFFSAFNPDAVKDVQIYKGAFPARYGGRLSSVINMVGRDGDPDRTHVKFGISLLSANASVELPISNLSLIVSGRRSFSDILASDAYNKIYELLTGAEAPQAGTGPRGGQFIGGGPSGAGFSQQETPLSSFADLNAKATYRLTPKFSLSASGYASSDNYDLTRSATSGNLGGFGGGGFNIPSRSSNTKQGNRGASFKSFAQWNETLYSTAIVSYAGYQSRYSNGSGTQDNLATRFSTEENNSIDDLTMSTNTEWLASVLHHVSFGFQASRTVVAYGLSGGIPTGNTDQILDLHQRGWLYSAHVADAWMVSDRTTLTGGFRLEMFTETAQVYVEPRLSIKHRLTDVISLKGAFGIHHQYVNRILNENLSEGSRDFWILSGRDLSPSRAIHYVAGATYESEGYVIDAEVFHKDLSNLVEFTQRFRRQAFDTYAFLSGDGFVNGLEILVQKKFGTASGWISYTLSRAEKRFPELNNGAYFPSENDQTHEIKVVGSMGLGNGWTLSSSFIFATGKPYTAPISQYSLTLLDNTSYSYTHVSEKNAYRLPDYHRLDLSATKRWRTAKSSFALGASLFNVYNRQNISYYEYDLQSQPIIITSVTGLGFLPTFFFQYEF